ncbi:MAG: SDR family NAD(P)-dependent oxidoreductase [Woeseiaceae bacterium]|nr:SDR family NAD(P)-dependent oxidoreductase [Woeseiaceae bacterium]
MIKLIRIAALAALLIVGHLAPSPVLAGDQKAVLITGASTGIGRNLAERLAEDGYFVYAGARKDKDLAELDAIENIKAVRLDVTKQDQVDAAVELVRSEGRGLWGLVNNAGVGGGQAVLETPIDEFNFVYAVNVEGVIRTTQAFAPLVIESKGRISTTGSIAGILAGEGYGAYSGSKHYIEAFTDSLATELEPLGVKVSVVEPGSYKSRIRRSAVARITEDIKAAGGEITEEMQQRATATAEREVSLDEPDAVTDAFLHALFDDAPLRRYMVVPNPDQQDLTVRQAVRELVELNQWGQYSFSRDELVAMVDELLQDQGASD